MRSLRTRQAPQPPSQQSRVVRPAATRSRADSEREADQASRALIRGLPVKTIRSSPEGDRSLPPEVETVLGSPGRPLDRPVRDFFEPRLGQDLRHVRVHADEQAAESARVLKARAYTIGRNIAFGAGRYDFESLAGRSLIAHELVHVLQQQQAGHPALQLQSELENYPEEERKKIKIVTLLHKSEEERLRKVYLNEKSSPNQRDYAEAPEGMVRFQAGIPELWEKGLKRVVQALVAGNSLPKSSSASVYLPPPDAVFRFTRFDHAETAQGTPVSSDIVVVDLVGKGTGGPLLTSTAAAVELKPGPVEIGGVKMTRKDKWQSSDWAMVEEAMSALPESILKKMSGLKLSRLPKKICKPKEAQAGTCNAERTAAETDAFDKKSITFFDVAFKESPTRYGMASLLMQVAAHEAGHYLDYQPLVAARNQYRISKDKKPLLGARSKSGAGYVEGKAIIKFNELSGSMKGAFREAAILDGAKVAAGKITEGGVTDYAQTSWMEMFAESFSLYLVDPDLLKAIRPNVYKYFEKTYPQEKKKPAGE